MTAEMVANISIAIWITNSICLVQTLQIKMPSHYWKDTKSCTLAFVWTDATKESVLAMKQLTMSVSPEYAAQAAMSIKQNWWIQKEGFRNREFITLTILNHALVRRQNVIKSIAHATQQVGSAPTYVAVTIASTATSFSINLQDNRHRGHIYRCNTRGRYRCRKKWTSSRSNSPNSDF